jgi:soluble lytic murein transglycosylase-like protein
MKKSLLQLGVLLTATLSFAASPTTRTVYDATLRNGFSIHHVRHEAVGDMTRLYTDDTSYIDIPTAEITQMTESQELIAPVGAPQPTLGEVVSAAGDKHQIDPDFINSVIRAESNFNPKARSSKGAQGLMQLMPGTASRLGVTDAYDPASNVNGGTQYLRELLQKYNGDAIKALAAYNAGPGRVQQYRGVPPYRETRAYVARIIKDFNKKKLADQKAAKTTNTASVSTPYSTTKGQ